MPGLTRAPDASSRSQLATCQPAGVVPSAITRTARPVTSNAVIETCASPGKLNWKEVPVPVGLGRGAPNVTSVGNATSSDGGGFGPGNWNAVLLSHPVMW